MVRNQEFVWLERVGEAIAEALEKGSVDASTRAKPVAADQ